MSRSGRASRVAEFHFSMKPDPHLVVFPLTISSCKIFDESIEAPITRVVVNLGLRDFVPVRGSVGGLILLWQYQHHHLFICNPVTREYVRLPDPHPPPPPPGYDNSVNNFGFGVSRRSQKYKVVWINIQHEYCQVYTLGTGQWRNIQVGPPLTLLRYKNIGCAFVGGNLHWLASRTPEADPFFLSNGLEREVSCFDLESETFTSFAAPPPPSPFDNPRSCRRSLSVLEDCLCLCDETSSRGGKTLIWLMRGEGNRRYWTKQFVISESCYKDSYRGFCSVFPIKVLKDDDIILLADGRRALLLCYSDKTKTVGGSSHFDPSVSGYATALVSTPSFLPLKTFLMEEEENDVQSF